MRTEVTWVWGPQLLELSWKRVELFILLDLIFVTRQVQLGWDLTRRPGAGVVCRRRVKICSVFQFFALVGPDAVCGVIFTTKLIGVIDWLQPGVLSRSVVGADVLTVVGGRVHGP